MTPNDTPPTMAEVGEAIELYASGSTGARDALRALFARAIEERPQSATRPYVDAFADEMEAKLAENRHKGDRDGWARMDVRWLFEQLRKEVAELDAALPTRRTVRGADSPSWGGGLSPLAIRRECADVANFAMMIADKFGMQPARAIERPACNGSCDIARPACNGSCDIALARRQVGPDGIVPGSARECAELWEREASRLNVLLSAYRYKRANDGLNGRGWHAGNHLAAEDRINELERGGTHE